MPQLALFALVYKGGEGRRSISSATLNRYPGIRAILDSHDDAALHRLMTNWLATTWLSVLAAFHAVTTIGRPLHRLHDQGLRAALKPGTRQASAG